jgi:hypothetical protein
MLHKPNFRAPLFAKVFDALVEHGASKTVEGNEVFALRLDVLAKHLGTNDPHGLLKSIQLYLESQRAGLLDQAFAVIPGRQQESFGLTQESFPRKEMPPMPDALKKRRVVKKAEKKPDDGKNWFPIIAVDVDGSLVRTSDPYDDVNELLQNAFVEDGEGERVRLLDVDGLRIVLRKDGWLVTRDTAKVE